MSEMIKKREAYVSFTYYYYMRLVERFDFTASLRQLTTIKTDHKHAEKMKSIMSDSFLWPAVQFKFNYVKSFLWRLMFLLLCQAIMSMLFDVCLSLDFGHGDTYRVVSICFWYLARLHLLCLPCLVFCLRPNLICIYAWNILPDRVSFVSSGVLYFAWVCLLLIFCLKILNAYNSISQIFQWWSMKW